MADSHNVEEGELYGEYATEVTELRRCTHKFWKSITRVFTGVEEPIPEQSVAFWNSIAFYNFVQESAGPKGISRPTKAMYEKSIPALRRSIGIP